jgi:hypothetical protein
MLSMDQTNIKIQNRVLGIEIMTKTFPLVDAHAFRFIPPGGYASGSKVVDPRTSKIQFKVGPKQYTFARGVTELEAFVLMERMHDFYKFPDFQKPRR